MYKLSPSDFAYLYEECKHCYYLKVRMKVTRPSMPFPGVFGAINTRLQGNMVGKNLRELSPSLPDGIVESQEGFVESVPFPGTQVFVKGKYDLLVRLMDGTYMIVDLKLSTPSEEKAAKYRSQLWSYVYAFEHPASGEAKQISRAGLLIFYPDAVSFAAGSASLTFPPTWIEVPVDRDAFGTFIASVSSLLEGPTPPENPNCDWCKYRHLGEALAHSQTSDIPF
uniref:PD-(D/E)XK nuclease family protein n=1 Tax=Candidatus Wunengus sp. YC60 TaxID=3367697 RepID=UPI004025B616